jgi:hypothetical protein
MESPGKHGELYMRQADPTKTFVKIVAQVADSLWKDSFDSEWIPLWRLSGRVESDFVDRARSLVTVLPRAAATSDLALREHLLDAAVALLVRNGRAEYRVFQEVEDVRFLLSTRRKRSQKHDDPCPRLPQQVQQKATPGSTDHSGNSEPFGTPTVTASPQAPCLPSQ